MQVSLGVENVTRRAPPHLAAALTRGPLAAWSGVAAETVEGYDIASAV